MEKYLRTKMDVTIEFDPKKTAFILGPSINRLCIDTDNCDPNCVPLDYTAVCEEGIKYALGFVHPDQCTNKRRLLQNACELNPLYAAHEVTSILTRNGVYDTWLMLLHNKMIGSSGQSMYTKHFALQFLSAMNQKGALLATTCYVEVLEQVLNLKPVSLTETAVNSKVFGNGGWPNSLLHIYGMFSQPGTVVFDFLAENPTPSLTKEGWDILKLFLQRNLFFVGFDGGNFDQAAQRFVELVSSQLCHPGAMLPIFFSLANDTSDDTSDDTLLGNFLKVYYGENTSLSVFHQMLYASGTNTDEPNFMKEFHIQNANHNTKTSGMPVVTNSDTVLSLIIHEKEKPDAVMGGILSAISKSTSLRLESVSYGAMVGQLRQVVLKFSTNGVLKLSQLILTNRLDLIAYDVVAFQLENAPLMWIQNRSQIARYLTTTSKGEFSPAYILKSAAAVEDTVATQQQRSPNQYISSPPPLWPVVSAAPKTPTKGETIPEVSAQSLIALPPKNLQSKASGKLSPLTLPTSPSSPEALSSASPFSTASTPAKYLSIVSGKHRAGLPEELDPYLSIECYDQLTKKLVPMHASMIGSEAELSLNGAPQREGPATISTSPKAASPLLSSSAAQSLSIPASLMPTMMGSKFQPEKSPTKVSIQPITLTHKYQENKQARQAKRLSEPCSKSSSESPSGGSNNDLSNVAAPTTKVVSGSTEIVTPVLKSPLPTHTMLNAANLAAAAAAAGVSLPTAIPQPFSLPIMFHPTFTPTTPGTQLPFVYPSALTPLGMNSPLSALQQFPMLSQAHPNQYMMVDCPATFVWPPCSKVAAGGSGFNFMMPSGSPSVLQTPPSSAIQEKTHNRKRFTPPPATIDGHAQAPNFITETSPKRPRADFIPPNNCPLSQVMTPLTNTTFAPLTTTTTTAAVAGRPQIYSGSSQTADNSNESGSDSDSKDNGESDSEDDVVTCLQQDPAPIEGTNNLPPFPNGRGVVQLWQFLLDMLLTPDKNYMIQWTGNEYEFTILQPDDIAALWGERKGKPRMNYDKLSRGLRYYYSKGIMDKVPGKKLTFKFTCNVEDYVKTRSSNPNAVQTLRAIIRNSKLGHDSDYSNSTVTMS